MMDVSANTLRYSAQVCRIGAFNLDINTVMIAHSEKVHLSKQMDGRLNMSTPQNLHSKDSLNWFIFVERESHYKKWWR